MFVFRVCVLLILPLVSHPSPSRCLHLEASRACLLQRLLSTESDEEEEDVFSEEEEEGGGRGGIDMQVLFDFFAYM